MKKNIKTSIIIIILIIIGISALFFIRGLRNREPQVTEDKSLGIPVETASVKKDDFEIIFSHSGTVKYLNRTKISPQVGGEIEKLLVEEGDEVEAGQILAKIDDQELQNNFDSAKNSVEEAELNLRKLKLSKIVAENNLGESKAGLEEAQSDFQQWQNDYQRDKKLYEADAIAEAKFEQTKTQYQKAQARLDRMKSSVNSAEKAIEMSELDIESAEKKLKRIKNDLENTKLKLNDTEIKSPIDGKLIYTFTEIGEIVGSAQPVFEIAKTNEVEVNVNVGMKELRQLNVGSKAVISYEKDNENIIESKISEIASATNPMTRTTELTIPSTNNDRTLKDGMFVSVDLISETIDNALLIPNKAIFNFKSAPHVYLIKENRAVRVKIETGLSDGHYTVVKSGLNEDDKIAVTNINDLQNETKVYLSERKNGDD